MNLIYLARLFFENLIRDKFFTFIFFSGALFGVVSIILNEISYGATEMIVRSFSLGFVSITINFLSVYFGLSIIHSESMRHSIIVLLCKPIRRFELILGATIAFIFAILIALMLIAFELYAIFNIFNINLSLVFLNGLLGIFYEGMIIFLLSIFLGLFLNNLISILFIFCIYILGHNVSSILQLGFFQRREGLASVIRFVSRILPDLSYFDFKYAIYNVVDYTPILHRGSYYFAFVFIIMILLITYFFSIKDHN